jgi:4-hydroxy-2-oxoheptanedioate aldolase
MDREPNKLRSKLATGRPVTGSVMYSWSPSVMEVAGYAGLDFMRVDNEHAWRQDSTMEHLMRAAHCAGIVPLVRVDKGNPYLIRKVLEIGAGGVIVPNVRTVEEARAAVEASKFPPLGSRGYSGQCWSAGWGTRADEEWIAWSDSEPMIGVMIENQQALASVDDIFALDGLDFALFGPADYAMSLGWRKTAKDSDEVQAALRRTIDAAQRANKHVMLGMAIDHAEIRRYAEMGVTMFEFMGDMSVLRAGWGQGYEIVQGLAG